MQNILWCKSCCNVAEPNCFLLTGHATRAVAFGTIRQEAIVIIKDRKMTEYAKVMSKQRRKKKLKEEDQKATTSYVVDARVRIVLLSSQSRKLQRHLYGPIVNLVRMRTANMWLRVELKRLSIQKRSRNTKMSPFNFDQSRIQKLLFLYSIVHTVSYQRIIFRRVDILFFFIQYR